MWCDPVYEVKIWNECLSKDEVKRRVKELEKSDFNLKLNNETNVVWLGEIIENKVKSTTLWNLWTVFKWLSEEYGWIYEKYVKLFRWSSGNSGSSWNNGSEGNWGWGESLKPKKWSSGWDWAWMWFSKKVKDRAREESWNRCVFCWKKTNTDKKSNPDKSEIDHAIPKSRWWNNTIDNAQNTCRTCNRKKSNKTTDEFLKSK